MPNQFSDIFTEIKKPALTGWHFYMFFVCFYFFSAGAGVAGAVCFAASGVVGTVVVGTAISSSPKIFEPVAPPPIKTQT